MGLNIYDVDGYVDILGSSFAWWTIINYVEKHRAKGPLYDFVIKGKTTDPEEVTADIVKMLPTITDPELKESFETLCSKLKECKEVAIVDE
jgi:hypothetical protein